MCFTGNMLEEFDVACMAHEGGKCSKEANNSYLRKIYM